jgi:NAD(P)-dependent dehydrogenase (short-subunit alcohol dehydrogenase family)
VAASGQVKRALVLGASSDIGVAVCQRFLDGGYQVTGHQHANVSACEPLTSQSGSFKTMRLDLADLDAVNLAAHGHQVANADVVILLAAIASPTRLDAIDPWDLVRALDVGGLANYLMISAAGTAMAGRGWGLVSHRSGDLDTGRLVAVPAGTLFVRVAPTGEDCVPGAVPVIGNFQGLTHAVSILMALAGQ